MYRVIPNACGSGGSSATYTKTEVDAKLSGYVAKGGDTMSGNLTFAATNIGAVHKDSGGVNWRYGVNPDGAHTTTSI